MSGGDTATRGIGETFATSPVMGTGSMSAPIAPARPGPLGPEVAGIVCSG
jgi:hypothetical protein